MYYEPV